MPASHLRFVGVLALCLCACSGGGGGGSSGQTPPPSPPASGLSPAAALGEKIFADKSLSASGRMSCETCHDPKFNYAAPNNLAVQLGGPGLNIPGFRAVPSIEYKERTPSFFQDPGLDGGVPVGGLMWDGRSATLQAQPLLPLLSPFEMANDSAADVVAKVQRAPYAQDFMNVFGADIFSNPDIALQKISFALAAYQMQDPGFHPYNSKYDYYLASCQSAFSALQGLGQTFPSVNVAYGWKSRIFTEVALLGCNPLRSKSGDRRSRPRISVNGQCSLPFTHSC